MISNVLGVLSGRDFPDENLRMWAGSADLVVAADSAGDRLLSLGLVPDIVVGDLDSSKADWSSHATTVIHDPSQETTDCDKLLAYTSQERTTLVGVEGDRFDHVLATLSSIAMTNSDVRLILRRGYGLVLRPGTSSTILTAPGQRFSLVPLTVARVTLSGAVWNLDDEELGLGTRVSISNKALGPIVVRSEHGVTLALLETEQTPKPDWGEPLWPHIQSP